MAPKGHKAPTAPPSTPRPLLAKVRRRILRQNYPSTSDTHATVQGRDQSGIGEKCISPDTGRRFPQESQLAYKLLSGKYLPNDCPSLERCPPCATANHPRQVGRYPGVRPHNSARRINASHNIAQHSIAHSVCGLLFANPLPQRATAGFSR